MDLKGSFIPLFRVPSQRTTLAVVGRSSSRPTLCVAKVYSSFGESFPVLYRRLTATEVQCNDSSHSIHQSSVSHSSSSRLPELSFDRLQPSEQELCGQQGRVFGRFVARGAVVDEEYWTAAWLRAEANWESLSYMRHVDSFKRKYAEQEFYSLKRRCAGRDGNSLKCFCIVAVKKEEKNVRRTVINSVVGTLDISIRQFLHGETFPGELKKTNAVLVSQEANDAHKYAYISNVCVSKYARRQGIASNMLYLAIDIAISVGMKQLFCHVNLDNKPAQELYRKTGFKKVEAASSSLLKDQRLLMCRAL
ncbi:GNAT domain-containing protein [Cinnamomum micranthum f. kanehirae]|uniref:GNAT domain-containing protein n=1 Tax=Cinnamomum micranthum f. kanehirae TaxID=337451 RepID=A0A443NBJ2_9MAGN|nr:GNAT domain-containing protein [Cinnamomum micranthum f. kanehirae]